MYVPIGRFLLRAPLLPASALRRGARALLAHPLGEQAIALASPALAAGRAGERRDRAIARYARRAAFRATPHGLLAGVCVGTLGAKTVVATGTPAAHLTPSWARVDAVARGLLDDEDIRERTRLRVAPSALRGAGTVCWIGPGDPFGELRSAEIDGTLGAVLGAAAHWTSWDEVRTRVAEAGGEGDADELLLTLVDDGLLQSDLSPPIVGPPAARHLVDRLAALGRPDAASEALDEAGDQHAVLVHRPAKTPVLARAAVERAARLVPLLVGLQEALAPPAAERLAQPALADALDAVTEIHGAGAFDLGGLVAGDYGVGLSDEDGDDAPAERGPDAGVLGLILHAVIDAAAHRRLEAALDPTALAEALARLGASVRPPTAELFLAPLPQRPRTPPGTGWLLGLHAPAGASVGRFAHALGAPLAEALTELSEAERRARPDEESVDVAFAPSPGLADLAAHPRAGRRTLTLSRWGDPDDLAPADLELVADPAAPDGLALRERATGRPVVPAQLSRLRSATAPAGLARLLCGWSLQRQHAPWALPTTPLEKLDFIPRLTLDGFVIAPASWRLPAAPKPAALARWRRERRVPRLVQVGEGDELLPVDLEAKDAADDLVGHARAFEIWPPLDEIVDRDGRRVEAVVMLVDHPDEETAREHARAAERVRRAGEVPPPHQAPPADGWRTFKVFGATAHQDELLRTVILPAIRAGRTAHEIDRWFFLRYVDGPGRRPHLRLRVRATGNLQWFERRLAAALAPARTRAAVSAVELGDYFPERGRFADSELDAVHALFESDSELCCALLGEPEADDALGRIVLATRAADALAAGLGLELAARHALAGERRRAAEAPADLDDDTRRAADAAFRACGRGLRAALDGELSGPLADHRARVAQAARELPADAADHLLPTLLHLSAVRLLGPDREGERLALTFWERTLEGLRKR